MANQWFRVWHDMPNDPKWRTIARVSGQSVPVVQSVFLQLLLSASQNVTRGHADVTLEDISSALDVTEAAVESVIEAMQGRVLDGMAITGWDKRQPKREDAGDPERAKSAAQRKREQREREKESRDVTKNCDGHEMSRNQRDKCHGGTDDNGKKSSAVESYQQTEGTENIENVTQVTQCHEESRNVTLDTDTDTDTERELKHIPNAPDGDSLAQPDLPKKPPEEKHRAKSVTKAQMRETFPDLTDQTVDDWLTARKSKGAKTLTVTAWNAVVNEVRISGLTGEQALQIAAARNWQGIKSEWLLNHISSGAHNGNQATPGNHQGQNGNRSGGSAFDKVMHEINAARQRDNRAPMGDHDAALRPQVDQQLRRGARPDGSMGSVIEGDYTRDD